MLALRRWRLCAFASFFTQQRGVLAGVGIGLFLIIQIGITECDWPQLMSCSAAIFSISFLAAISLLLLPFILAAGPERFYECTVLFLRNYVEDPSTNGVESYFGTLAKVSTLGLLMTAVTIFYYLLVPLVYIFTLIALWIKRKAINVQNRTGLLVLCLVGLLLSIGTLAPNAVRIFHITAGLDSLRLAHSPDQIQGRSDRENCGCSAHLFWICPCIASSIGMGRTDT